MDEEDLRVRLKDGLKEQFDAVLKRKKMKQVTGVNQLVAWFIAQDDLFQSMILGQIGPDSTTEIAQLLLEKILADQSPHTKQRASPPRKRGKAS